MILFIHELGHVLIALFYQWNINKISIYPFGGIIKFNEIISKPLLEELLILIGGPLLQIVFYLFSINLLNNGYILSTTFDIIKNYHYSLLFFNLLPIYPLDGSKIINILTAKFFSFKLAHLLLIYISYIGILVVFIFSKYFNFNTSLYFLLLILMIKVFKEYQNHNMIFEKFLLERFLYTLHFKKRKIIEGTNVKKMMRNKKHLFIDNKKYITEKEILKKWFKTS